MCWCMSYERISILNAPIVRQTPQPETCGGISSVRRRLRLFLRISSIMALILDMVPINRKIRKATIGIVVFCGAVWMGDAMYAGDDGTGATARIYPMAVSQANAVISNAF